MVLIASPWWEVLRHHNFLYSIKKNYNFFGVRDDVETDEVDWGNWVNLGTRVNSLVVAAGRVKRNQFQTPHIQKVTYKLLKPRYLSNLLIGSYHRHQ
jgi:hypothetical protein